ncbi:MAG: hypothetical protein Tsb0032_34440 [Kiloniellaceae bacterium]
MKKTLTALMVAAGVVGFAGASFAGCGFHTVQSSKKPTVTADAGQSKPVTTTTTTETATN